MKNKLTIFAISFIFFYGFFSNNSNVMAVGFLLCLVLCSYYDYKFDDMTKRRNKHKNAFKRMQEIYKDLELGVRKNVTRY